MDVPYNNDSNKNLSPRGVASNLAQRIIGQNFFLTSDMNFKRQFLYQTEFKQTSI
jgi:hypothetical protein